MTLIPITATRTGLCLGTSAGVTPEGALARAMADLPPGAPVVIMVHGRGYRPGQPQVCPHSLIFAPRGGHGASRFVSWPRRLGFALPGPRRPLGLCLGLGWDSAGSVWRATRAADRTAPMLARLVQAIRRIDPGRRVDLIGHSLGALAPFAPRAALGRGLPGAANWLDIQIDHPATAAALKSLGLPLARPRARVCHWSVYLRPGTFRLYRALIHDRARLSLPVLRAALSQPPQPRWTRLMALRPA